MSSDNLQRWLNYMKNVGSPNSFIEWSFYYIIAASLQRRIFCGPVERPIFANIYVIFVADPSIGKGMCLVPVNTLLRHHKLQVNGSPTYKSKPNEEVITTEELGDMYEELQKKGYERPLLIPVGPDSITFEQLIAHTAKSIRAINYKIFDKTLDKEVIKPYTHSSLCFALEEISTLFRKKTEDITTFFLKSYDCGDYIYETKTAGIHKVRKCCLSFLGGTTPTFIQRVFSDDLLTQGFASRSFFIFEYANRFNTLRLPEFNNEQLKDWQTLLDHVLKLTKLYGQIKFTEEADKWMNDYLYGASATVANASPKLKPYYGRKNLHLQKMAMIVHFSDKSDLSGYIELSECQEAAEILEKAEKKMHLALAIGGANPLAKVSKLVENILKDKGPQAFKDLLLDCWEEAKDEELKEVLQFMRSTKKINIREDNKYELT